MRLMIFAVLLCYYVPFRPEFAFLSLQLKSSIANLRRSLTLKFTSSVDQKNSDRMVTQLLNSIIAKYRDLSVSRRSIFCLGLRLWQIIDLLATDKSRYFSQPGSIVNCVFNLSSKPKIWQLHVVVLNKAARNCSKVRAARLFFLVPPIKLLIHVVDVEVIPMNNSCLSPAGHTNIDGTWQH